MEQKNKLFMKSNIHFSALCIMLVLLVTSCDKGVKFSPIRDWNYVNNENGTHINFVIIELNGNDKKTVKSRIDKFLSQTYPLSTRERFEIFEVVFVRNTSSSELAIAQKNKDLFELDDLYCRVSWYNKPKYDGSKEFTYYD